MFYMTRGHKFGRKIDTLHPNVDNVTQNLGWIVCTLVRRQSLIFYVILRHERELFAGLCVRCSLQPETK